MLGIDKTTISRFINPSNGLIKKILHFDEIKEYELCENKPYYLAAHWAIKEALYKADNSKNVFSEIKIEKKDRVYSYPGFIISTTSENDDYIAIVMKEGQSCK